MEALPRVLGHSEGAFEESSFHNLRAPSASSVLGSDRIDTLVCRLDERGDFPGKPIGLVEIYEVSAVLEFEIACMW